MDGICVLTCFKNNLFIAYATTQCAVAEDDFIVLRFTVHKKQTKLVHYNLVRYLIVA